MAGMAGFEPTDDGVKVRCLTAWLHPNTIKKTTTTKIPVVVEMGWIIGFEPMASRATTWRSNQLSYTHRKWRRSRHMMYYILIRIFCQDFSLIGRNLSEKLLTGALTVI